MRPPSNTFKLALLPTSARLLVTLFLALVGFGYLAALSNLYNRHQSADGLEGLTLNDVRATFHGLQTAADAATATTESRSRMMELVEPGGEMRKHLTKGGSGAVRALENWLHRGALESEFGLRGIIEPDDPSAQAVIERHCLRCHNADDGEKADTPYGSDLFAADHAMVYVYAAPGTAHARVAPSSDEREPKVIGPQATAHLALITHIHMLSVPVFTLIVSGLFLMTGVNPRLRGVLAVIPMLALGVDFAGWWLARVVEPFIYVIPAAGATYGAALALQIVTVVCSLWFGRRSASAGRERAE